MLPTVPRTLIIVTLAILAGWWSVQQPESGGVGDRGAQAAAMAQQPTLIQDATAGLWHTCAVDAAGRVYCEAVTSTRPWATATDVWGDVRWPVSVQGLTEPVAEIAAGGTHTCVRTTRGGVKCWGWNSHGQLGNGTSMDQGGPEWEVSPADVVGLTSGVSSVVAGFRFTCAVTVRGAAQCWGDQPSGGPSDVVPRTIPGLEAGVAALAASIHHACALMADGGTRCWGNNQSGQLGDGSTDARADPQSVVGLTSVVRNVTTATAHSCALLDNGGIACWGDNELGQLGDGTDVLRPAPVPVQGLPEPARAVAAGGAQTCAILDSGAVWCWGRNNRGQLGLGYADDEPHPRPAPVVGLPAAAIGIASSAAGHPWLDPQCFDLPDPSCEEETTPYLGGHICAWLIDGRLSCWGANGFGQLGNGSRTGSPVPVDLFWPRHAILLPTTLR